MGTSKLATPSTMLKRRFKTRKGSLGALSRDSCTSSVVDGLGFGIQGLPSRGLASERHEALDVELLPGLRAGFCPSLRLPACISLLAGRRRFLGDDFAVLVLREQGLCQPPC